MQIGSALVTDIPDELQCRKCMDLLQDAVVLPCCGNSTCASCAKECLSVGGNCTWCDTSGYNTDHVIPNKQLRLAVENYTKESGYVPQRSWKQTDIVESSALYTESFSETPDIIPTVTSPKISSFPSLSPSLDETLGMVTVASVSPTTAAETRDANISLVVNLSETLEHELKEAISSDSDGLARKEISLETAEVVLSASVLPEAAENSKENKLPEEDLPDSADSGPFCSQGQSMSYPAYSYSQTAYGYGQSTYQYIVPPPPYLLPFYPPQWLTEEQFYRMQLHMRDSYNRYQGHCYRGTTSQSITYHKQPKSLNYHRRSYSRHDGRSKSPCSKSGRYDSWHEFHCSKSLSKHNHHDSHMNGSYLTSSKHREDHSKSQFSKLRRCKGASKYSSDISHRKEHDSRSSSRVKSVYHMSRSKLKHRHSSETSSSSSASSNSKSFSKSLSYESSHNDDCRKNTKSNSISKKRHQTNHSESSDYELGGAKSSLKSSKRSSSDSPSAESDADCKHKTDTKPPASSCQRNSQKKLYPSSKHDNPEKCRSKKKSHSEEHIRHESRSRSRSPECNGSKSKKTSKLSSLRQHHGDRLQRRSNRKPSSKQKHRNSHSKSPYSKHPSSRHYHYKSQSHSPSSDSYQSKEATKPPSSESDGPSSRADLESAKHVVGQKGSKLIGEHHCKRSSEPRSLELTSEAKQDENVSRSSSKHGHRNRQSKSPSPKLQKQDGGKMSSKKQSSLKRHHNSRSESTSPCQEGDYNGTKRIKHSISKTLSSRHGHQSELATSGLSAHEGSRTEIIAKPPSLICNYESQSSSGDSDHDSKKLKKSSESSSVGQNCQNGRSKSPWFHSKHNHDTNLNLASLNLESVLESSSHDNRLKSSSL